MSKAQKSRKGVSPTEMKMAEDLTREYNQILPSAEAVVREAMNAIRPRFGDAEQIKDRASEFLLTLMQTATEIYYEYERRAMGFALANTYGRFTTDSSGAGVVEALRDYPKALDTFFLSVSQSRKSRAGSTFERFIKSLLDELGYPYTYQPEVDGRPDFILPSMDWYNQLAMDCIVLTAKTTLRERWRQITTEGTRGGILFLATIDEKVKQNDLMDMATQKIYLVVPSSVKDSHYASQANVISVETFLTHHVDPAVNRWTK
jgi:hypothetical protein